MSDFDPDARPLELRLAGAPGAMSARTLQRRASSGELQRVRRGVYAAADEWSSTSSAHRARSALGAVVAKRAQRPVLCGESAALIWGLPRLGRWPIEAQLADTRRSRPRSRHGVRWIQAEFDPAEIVELDGYLLTDLRRTLVDVARTRSFANAVVALDHGTKRWVLLPTGIEVPGVGRAALLDRLDGCGSGRGIRGARSAIGFSDPAAANPGESLSVRGAGAGFGSARAERSGAEVRRHAASAMLSRLPVCRIARPPRRDVCTTLLLQRSCSRLSPKEVG
ncbi:hypothetical protein EDM22_11770 [Agromyces tardus]|uniref:AbiEi antitoxin C-terminal domain-containing protein n=1 Tax=Agromyces tardus TaxID=2583849 RepID=A0A3M8A909_9MICO|nr:hypothetical protein [Agromyces tardus]RNB47743.1 hypothetical protein EDM22_11770 [Agromyces tardus]